MDVDVAATNLQRIGKWLGEERRNCERLGVRVGSGKRKEKGGGGGRKSSNEDIMKERRRKEIRRKKETKESRLRENEERKNREMLSIDRFKAKNFIRI